MANYWAKYWKLSKKIEDRMAEKIEQFFLDAERNIDINLLAERLQKGMQFVEQVIEFPDLTKYLQDIYVAMLREVYEIALEEVLDIAGKVQKARFGLDIKNPKVYSYIQENSANLIKYISEESREAIKTILVESYEKGAHPYDMAKKIKSYIGLTPKYASAVERYRATLEQQGAKKINEKVERYKENLLKTRARTIARTETIRSLCGAQYMAWEEMIERGYYKRDMLAVEWITTPDDIACELCVELDNKVVKYGEEFVSGVLHPPLHPNCRCAIQLTTAEPEAVEQVETPPLPEIDIENIILQDGTRLAEAPFKEEYLEYYHCKTLEEVFEKAKENLEKLGSKIFINSNRLQDFDLEKTKQVVAMMEHALKNNLYYFKEMSNNYFLIGIPHFAIEDIGAFEMSTPFKGYKIKISSHYFLKDEIAMYLPIARSNIEKEIPWTFPGIYSNLQHEFGHLTFKSFTDYVRLFLKEPLDKENFLDTWLGGFIMHAQMTSYPNSYALNRELGAERYWRVSHEFFAELNASLYSTHPFRRKMHEGPINTRLLNLWRYIKDMKFVKRKIDWATVHPREMEEIGQEILRDMEKIIGAKIKAKTYEAAFQEGFMHGLSLITEGNKR